MLAYVVRITVRVSEVVALISIRGHVFLVRRPADARRLQEVDDRGDVVGNIGEIIGCKSEEVASDGCDVVGLTRVGDGVVAGEKDTLASQILEDGTCERSRKVDVLEPDLDEAIENLSVHEWTVVDRAI